MLIVKFDIDHPEIEFLKLPLEPGICIALKYTDIKHQNTGRCQFSSSYGRMVYDNTFSSSHKVVANCYLPKGNLIPFTLYCPACTDIISGNFWCYNSPQ